MKVWSCGICGYVHHGDSAPDKCPNCGAEMGKFSEVEEDNVAIHVKVSEKFDEGDSNKINQFFGSFESLQPFVYNLPAGSRIPLHKHPTTDEIFYIIRGKFKFNVGGEEIIAEPGDVIQGKMDVPHTFQNISDEQGSFLSIKGPKPVDRVMME